MALSLVQTIRNYVDTVWSGMVSSWSSFFQRNPMALSHWENTSTAKTMHDLQSVCGRCLSCWTNLLLESAEAEDAANPVHARQNHRMPQTFISSPVLLILPLRTQRWSPWSQQRQSLWRKALATNIVSKGWSREWKQINKQTKDRNVCRPPATEYNGIEARLQWYYSHDAPWNISHEVQYWTTFPEVSMRFVPVVVVSAVFLANHCVGSDCVVM